MKIKIFSKKWIVFWIMFCILTIYMTSTTIDSIDKSTIEFLSQMQLETIEKNFLDDIDLLKDTAMILSQNMHIIETLEEISTGEYDSETISKITDNINNFIPVLNINYIRSISVVSIANEFIVSDDMFVENYNIYDRPWFGAEMIYEDSAIVTPVYKNYIGEELTVSVVKFIIDSETNQPLGAILINLELDDVVNNIRQIYKVSELDIMIQHDNIIEFYFNNKKLTLNTKNLDISTMYPNTELSILTYENDYSKVTLLSKINAINYEEYIEYNRSHIITRVLMLTITLAGILIVAGLVAVMPIFKAIQSLVNLIEELGENYPEYKLSVSKVSVIAKFVEQNIPKHFKYLIYNDELTGLPNRKMLKTYYKQFAKTNKEFITILINVKQLREINEKFGDNVADYVLMNLAVKLTAITAELEAVVIRYISDEFIIMIESQSLTTTPTQFYDNEILPLISKSLTYPDKPSINISFNAVGIINPLYTVSEEEMINKLHVMLKYSKELDNTGLLLFNLDVYSIYNTHERIKEYLGKAIETDEFVLYYQPIIDKFKNIRKAEALIRWNSQELGFIPPNEFISIAEDTGIIIELGYWVIERVAKDLCNLLKEGYDMQISINVSPVQIMQADFVENAMKILNYYEIDTAHICFEITESILVAEKELVHDRIGALQKAGIVVALDDFGTGYSSFSYLKEYSLDIVKIDKLFVDDATQKEYAIIDGMERISKALNMQMIIEGVETKEQFDKLKKYGLIQGYYFSRPIVWEEFTKLVKKRKS
ncbi:MAG: hypothetical protein BEN19_05495 [Epulopiscium sp. Nuni2H_MBin003]|nr:MAG: hypothetical protein BEN19_05495 [Epulopiscium sp. Nuni2H_MBin003]